MEPTEKITIEDTEYLVANLPEEIQSRVKVYDIFREDGQKAKHEFLKCEAAMRDFGILIAKEVKEWEAAEQSVTDAEADTPTTATEEQPVTTEAPASDAPASRPRGAL